MASATLLKVLADLVLLAHFAVVLFVLGGLAAVLAGAWLGWRWVRNPWLRAAHLAATGLIAVQAWLGHACPLTRLEMGLRAAAGESTYGGAFIAYWVGRLLYYDAPMWVFAIVYTAFAALVAAAWRLVPPARFGRRRGAE